MRRPGKRMGGKSAKKKTIRIKKKTTMTWDSRTKTSKLALSCSISRPQRKRVEFLKTPLLYTPSFVRKLESI